MVYTISIHRMRFMCERTEHQRAALWIVENIRSSLEFKTTPLLLVSLPRSTTRDCQMFHLMFEFS